MFDCSNFEKWSFDETIKKLSEINKFVKDSLISKEKYGNYKHQLINLAINYLDENMPTNEYVYIVLSNVITIELQEVTNIIASQNIDIEKYNNFMKLLYIDIISIIEPQSCTIRKQANVMVNNYIFLRLSHLHIFNEDMYDIPSICSAIIRQSIDLYMIEYLNKRKNEGLVEIKEKDFYKLREIYSMILDSNEYNCIEKIYSWASGYVHNGKLVYLWEVLLFNRVLYEIYSKGYKEISINELNSNIDKILKKNLNIR